MAEVSAVAGKSSPSAQSVLAAAWRSWGLCVAAPGAWLGYVVYTLRLEAQGGAQNAHGASSGAILGLSGTGGGWLVALAMIWLALMGPAIFVLRSYCFRAVWDGRVVEPESYLKGMASIWAVLVVGAVLALLGALVSGQWLPGVAVAGVAIGLVVLVRPSGKAMGVGA